VGQPEQLHVDGLTCYGWLRPLRDHEHPLEVPPVTVRIAVLGDSYMQGTNVPREATSPTFLEDAVARCLAGTGRVAETLNFGVWRERCRKPVPSSGL